MFKELIFCFGLGFLVAVLSVVLGAILVSVATLSVVYMTFTVVMTSGLASNLIAALLLIVRDNWY